MTNTPWSERYEEFRAAIESDGHELLVDEATWKREVKDRMYKPLRRHRACGTTMANATISNLLIRRGKGQMCVFCGRNGRVFKARFDEAVRKLEARKFTLLMSREEWAEHVKNSHKSVPVRHDACGAEFEIRVRSAVYCNQIICKCRKKA